MGIIESEVRITGQDAGASAMIERIGKKLDAMGKAARISPEVDKLSQSLGRAEAQLKAIDKYNSAKSLSDIGRKKVEDARRKVAELKTSMEGVEAPTRRMTAALEKAEAAEARLMAQQRRRAAAVLESKSALSGMGIALGEVGSAETALRAKVDGTTKALEKQMVAERKLAAEALERAKHAEKAHAIEERAAERRQHYMAHHGAVGMALGAAAGAVGVHGVLRVGEAAWEAGAERQHVITGMRTAGMPQEEIDRAQVLAEAVSRQAPNMSTSQILELHKEARSAVQHPEEVFHLMPDLARAASVLKGMGAENANIADLVKGGESLGLMNDPKRFHGFLEGQVKAMQVMGKTITTEQIYEAAKYSKATGSTLSDEFLNLTLPSLIQEMHGSSAGDALSALNKRFRGGMMHQHLAAKRMEEMGLLDDPSKIIRNKTGEIIGYSGKVKGDETLTHDPGKWFETFFKEGAAKVGAKSLEDINKLLAEVLPATAANLGRIFIQQEDTLRQHRANYESASDLEDAVEKQKADWSAAKQALRSSLEDLGAAVTGVHMGQAAKGLSWLADEIKNVAAAAAAHPNIAIPAAAVAGAGALAGAGYLSYQFMTAGLALQTSATMLDEAAVRLGANPLQKLLPSAATVAEASTTAAEGGALATGAVGLAAGVGVAGTLAGLEWLIHQSSEAQKAGHGGAWAPATFETRDADEYALAEQKDRLGELQARADRARSSAKFPDMPNPVLQQLEDEIADLRNQIAAREASLAKVPKFPIGPASDGNAPTMLGYGAEAKRKGGIALPDVPLSSIGANAIVGGPLPIILQVPPAAVAASAPPAVPALPAVAPAIGAPLDIRPPGLREDMTRFPPITMRDGQVAVPGTPQQIDVTGKVQSDVSVTTGGTIRVDVVASPGVEAKVGFQGITTNAVAKPSTGASMPDAGLPSHPGRMGPN